MKYESIVSDKRIALADVNPPGSGLGTIAGAYMVRFYVNKTAAPNLVANSVVPMFWLPYHQNTVRKITLVDKRNSTTIRREGGEARIFLTSALNGCSVIVEGTLEHPTVYHINAGSYRTTVGPINDIKTHDDRITRIEEIERQWRFMKSSSNQFDINKSVGQTPATAGAIHGCHYIPNYFKNRTNEDNVALQYYQLAGQQEFGINLNNITADELEHTAVVMGWKSRDTGHWEFWFQTRARVKVNNSYYLLPGGRMKFWPNVNEYAIQRGVHTLSDVYVRQI
jgi:hypothetical protein